ncbi:MAG: hypothetical protein E7549_01140 [Ruminococcaceae bacterium]|nr:hypothetical protein [Oscillospiraceae bacterium]
MFEFFSQVIGFFQTIFAMIVNICTSLLTLFYTLQIGSSFIGAVLSFFPAVIAASMTAVVAISVVKLIIGR